MQLPPSSSTHPVFAGWITVVLGALLLVTLVHAEESPTVVINEVLYDAVGADQGHEWIELYNAGNETTNLSGWRIERAGTQFASVFTFSDGVAITAGEFLLVGESAVTGADASATLVFQNGGSATDGIRLVNDDGGVVDVLLYDAPNANNLPDEAGIPGASFAPDVAEGHSLARIPNGADTNASGADFGDSSAPTPKAANVPSEEPTPTPLPTARSAPLGVFVSEALPNPVGDDASGEFIEIFNSAKTTVDISGAQIDDAEGGSSPYKIPDGTTIVSGAYRAFSRADTKLALNNEGDAVRLLAADGSLVASLTYGKVPREGASWARKDDGSADWTMSPTAGASNIFTPLDGAEKKGSAAGTATPSPRASPSTQRGVVGTSTLPRQPSRSVASPKIEGHIQGTASTGTTRASEAVAQTPESETEGRKEEPADAEVSEAAATDAPAPPSESPVPQGASPASHFPLPAILAWSAAGVVGIWRFLVTRRG